MKEDFSTKVNDTVNRLYHYYGSDSGMLFGIPNEMRGAVYAVVRSALQLQEKQRYQQEDEDA